MKKMSNPMTIMPVSSLIILLLIPRAVSVRSAASGAPFGLDSRATEISASAHKAHSSPRWTERRRAASFCFVCHLVFILDCFETHLCMFIASLRICTCTCLSGRLRLYTNSHICIPRFGTRYGHRPRPPRVIRLAAGSPPDVAVGLNVCIRMCWWWLRIFRIFADLAE